jgi:hypothetical protein
MASAYTSENCEIKLGHGNAPPREVLHLFVVFTTSRNRYDILKRSAVSYSLTNSTLQLGSNQSINALEHTELLRNEHQAEPNPLAFRVCKVSVRTASKETSQVLQSMYGS